MVIYLNHDGQFIKTSGTEPRIKKDDPEAKAKRVFVGNLSFQTSWQKVKDYMKEVGSVERVHIFTNKDGRSKGCGYCLYNCSLAMTFQKFGGIFKRRRCRQSNPEIKSYTT